MARRPQADDAVSATKPCPNEEMPCMARKDDGSSKVRSWRKIWDRAKSLNIRGFHR